MKPMKITKKKLLVLVGALIALSPFLGLPGFVKSIIIVILGLSVATVALVNNERKLCECDNCVVKIKPGSYIENAPSSAEQAISTADKEKKSGSNSSSPIRI